MRVEYPVPTSEIYVYEKCMGLKPDAQNAKLIHNFVEAIHIFVIKKLPTKYRHKNT